MNTPRLLAATLIVSAALAQQPAAPPKPAPIVLSNDKIQVAVSPQGATFTQFTLKQGDTTNPIASIGHFLALDGFGTPSPTERAAGMQFHGEAQRTLFKIVTSEPKSLSLEATFPLAQENFRRSIELIDGESVAYVTSELESLIGIDRPITWAEHATIGPPFLEKGKTVVDMSATDCKVRGFRGGGVGRLETGKDFKWPMAPAPGGGESDIRIVPTDKNTLDHSTCIMDPARTNAYVTALHLDKHLLHGYIFKREDYPWLMSWMNYSGAPNAARGMEFATQPFDISHRDAVAMNPTFGVPTFKWLGAKAKLRTSFIMYSTMVPANFTKITDVKLEAGKITITDVSGQTVTLAASKGI